MPACLGAQAGCLDEGGALYGASRMLSASSSCRSCAACAFCVRECSAMRMWRLTYHSSTAQSAWLAENVEDHSTAHAGTCLCIACWRHGCFDAVMHAQPTLSVMRSKASRLLQGTGRL